MEKLLQELDEELKRINWDLGFKGGGKKRGRED